jgi:hypothetical protein
MDIVKRLRVDEAAYDADDMDLHQDAADEIERLREEVMAWWKEAELMRSDLAVYSSEIERLRDELQRIADVSERWEDSLVSQINEMAHKALKEKE